MTRTASVIANKARACVLHSRLLSPDSSDTWTSRLHRFALEKSTDLCPAPPAERRGGGRGWFGGEGEGGGTWKGASKRQFKSLTLSHLTYVRHAWSETDNAPMVGESSSYDRNMPAVSFFFCLFTKSSRSLLSRTGFVGRPDRLFYLGQNNFNTEREM